ncbi:MAG: wax ester/triacylglycerol synthase family O-acyltransferase [Myxococcota bacterium]
MATHTFDRLSAQDSSFVMFEGPGTHMHVSAIAVFETGPLKAPEGGLDIERIRSYVESRLHLLPRYRQRLAFTPVERHPVWVDDDRFNLNYHVRHTSLPRPGSEELLKKLAGRIMSQQLDRGKPLWELWFVEGLEGGRFAMIGKTHHCMVDGASGVGVITALLSGSADVSIEPAPPWAPRPAPGRFELLRHALSHRVAAPTSALRAIRGALREPQEASTRFAEHALSVWQALNAGFRVPANTPLNAPIGTHRRIDWSNIDLAEIKELKKRLDGSVNDVVLAVVAGALRRYLGGRRVPLDGMDFRIAIPVNMRSDSGDVGAANRVSAWFLSLPLAEGDPLRRFEQIRAETQRLKRSKAAEGIDLFVRFAEWSGSTLLTFWGVRLASTLHPYNLIVTNVPGPQYPLYLLGAKLNTMIPQLPLFQNQGLGVAVMSYLGKVTFGLIGEWDLAPDLPALARAIDASFTELRDAAQRAPEPRREP